MGILLGAKLESDIENSVVWYSTPRIRSPFCPVVGISQKLSSRECASAADGDTLTCRREVRLTAEGTAPTSSTACSAARAAALSSDDRHSDIARLRSGIRMPRVVLWSR